MNPLVSIIVPVFNQNETHFRACIESALVQSYHNIEIIISDNHSTNDVPEVIEKYISRNVRKVMPPNFLGMTENFAFAASCADSKSKYLSFLSSDDLLAPNAIADLVELAEEKPSAVFFAGNIIQSIEPPTDFAQIEGRIRISKPVAEVCDFEESIGLFCPWHRKSTWMAGDLILHEAYIATGGFAACDYYLLGDLWLTKELIKQKNAQFGLVSRTTAFFRQREAGVLPADGDRGLSVYLDILNYNNEVLEIARSRGVGIKLRLRIRLSSYCVLLKTVLLILLARKFTGSFSPADKLNFQRHIKSSKRLAERYFIGWAITVKGISLYVAAQLARVLVGFTRGTLSYIRAHAAPIK